MTSSVHMSRSFPHTLPELRCEWSLAATRHGHQASSEALEKSILQPGASVSLGIGLTTACNFSCPTCYYHGHDWKGFTKSRHEMPLATLQRILRSVGPLDRVVFATEGEPFLYSRIWEALDLAANAAQGITLTSNGSLISNTVALQLRQYPLERLFLSIDGADEATYEKFRKGGHFRSFTRATSLLTKSLGKKIIFHAVLCAQNCTNLIMLPRLARSLGVESISLAQIRMHPAARARGLEACSPDVLWSFLNEFLAEAQDNNIVIFFDAHFADRGTLARLRPLLQGEGKASLPPATACSMLWEYTTITQDCCLFPCCGDFQPAKILHEDFSFDTIFNHEYLRLLRAMMLLGTYPKSCNVCLHQG